MAYVKKSVTTNPNVRLAVKTMAAIEAAIEADQGNAYRGWLGKVLPHMKDAYRTDEDGYRTHLGASVIGRQCPREVYYGWRWFKQVRFSGRMLRLFNRGHLEEGRIIAALLTIGVQVYQQDETGQQFRITHANGHIGGSGDGKVVGIPDLPVGTTALAEFKTYNEKLFAKLKAGGVKEAKPEHYTQMTIYMEKMGIPVGVYFGINKNDDEIYAEIIVLNRYHADEYLTLGESIAFAETPPNRISTTPGDWRCTYCDYRKECFKLPGAQIARNCRTCQHSIPLQSGEWYCNMQAKPLSKAEQIAGCGAYESL